METDLARCDVPASMVTLSALVVDGEMMEFVVTEKQYDSIMQAQWLTNDIPGEVMSRDDAALILAQVTEKLRKK
jgi:hypothetical protein